MRVVNQDAGAERRPGSGDSALDGPVRRIATERQRNKRAPTARVESVAKAARILSTFQPEVRLLTVREISSRTALPRSTCHALCATLTTEGLLEQAPGGGYRLGAALAGMGAQVIERTGLVEAATDSMQRLSQAVGGEIHLGQFVAGWTVYLIRVEHARRMPMRNRLGLRVPAYLTGCGKAALSMLESEMVEQYVLRTSAESKRPDVRALIAELAVARRQGFVVSDSFQRGVVSVAAPLIGRDGTVVGGMSAAHERTMVDRARTIRIASSVVDAAKQTSQRLSALRCGA
jgi:IclR family acetate operon transcriptional repressor